MKPISELLAEVEPQQYKIADTLRTVDMTPLVCVDVEHYRKLKAVAVELANGLEFAIQDVSTGHWEDACKVPPNYELCDHCWLIAHLTAARKLMEEK